MKLSEEIEIFLELCRICEAKYNLNNEILETCNRKTSDFLHAIELEKLTYQQRAKLVAKERS